MQARPVQDWLPYRDSYLDELLRHESPRNANDSTCVRCSVNIGNIKCKDCIGGSLHCSQCILDAHNTLPFHRLLVSLKHTIPVADTYSDVYQRWTGEYFDDFTLQQLGLKIQLGHDGEPCPLPCADTVIFTIVDTSGIHDVDVSFCNCVGAPHRRVQLLRASWMPASIDRPKSAFTFDVLDTFHLLTLQGKTSAYDYYYSLAHKSDNTGLRNLKVIIYYYFSPTHSQGIHLTGPLRTIFAGYLNLAASQDAQASWSRT